ncbi:MAG TPA: hypothetical protein VFN25_06850 [Dokdonella sp.]|uniref:hypothetical protein n=1 Tax=Dokdonella sp. TaxID=2291710 RepID=UPI002D8070DC|nr:hypothetical protein [Dokdonella sp.]HET9032607.1 hypothetical protein [Dokdonella sp.]
MAEAKSSFPQVRKERISVSREQASHEPVSSQNALYNAGTDLSFRFATGKPL